MVTVGVREKPSLDIWRLERRQWVDSLLRCPRRVIEHENKSERTSQIGYYRI